MTFVQEFDPDRGDIVYGRGEVRQVYFDTLPLTAAQREAIRRGLWVRLDDYNNNYGVAGRAFGDRGDQVTEATVNAFVDARGAAFEGGTPPADPGHARRLDQKIAYFDAIRRSASRFAPASVFELGRRDLVKEGTAYPKGPIRRFLNPSRVEEANRRNRANKAIRRVCKLGIAMVATDVRFHGAKILFALDGLDMASVVEKATREAYGRVAMPVTSSELRFCFRNWDALQGTVLFYVNGERVSAPWDDDWTLANIADPRWAPTIRAEKALWHAYHQQRVDKYGGTIPNKRL